MQNWLIEQLQRMNMSDALVKPEGFTREGYTSEETNAIAVFKAIAEELGLAVAEDAAGNIIARWEVPGGESAAVATGSHLDTVPNGGAFDGGAGVVCGLGAVKMLKEADFEPQRPIEVICFRSEESSRFGVSTIGSKAMSGLLDPAIGALEDQHGTTLAEAVNSQGFDWQNLSKAKRPKEQLKSFVELHIEQGMHIIEHKKNYGIVNGVACPIRLAVTFSGKAGHTGTTPMDRRQDALAAAAPFISFVQETALQLNDSNGKSLMATVSTLTSAPNSMNVIPQTVTAGVDIRSVDDSLKKKMADAIRCEAERIEQATGVSIAIEVLVDNPSVLLDRSIAQELADAGEQEAYLVHRMDSGAGHDVMNMAQVWPSGLLFIPCKDGLSHHPDEYATAEDLKMGVELLARFLMEATTK
ncbi:Zn-dependent hydrolase [Planococcus antarcticus DSM 14505]|uniref:Zn-dependent hydrolase n=1 Tax=Planococcus antarcticus DSM 14505 TaxID=1185653 RepID=A0ABN4RQH6_9BACL|nr:M20 family metallo-hydrolase [Planococcus antarcticus]ANU11945.1 Zn-dependent hydrolase [Planococcus antarcticus DSM 14505]